ncbi:MULTISPECIES: ParB/RepB/Spo0J family partition protein [Rhizobium]|uniref:ParB/RepB/Spo0J family partition protein n=1 Tax=Rhizobium TaxID=379 RepID=UPI0019344EE1|nr:ParB N-terminal domain-containing protein [Rhizobium rosettiformans]
MSDISKTFSVRVDQVHVPDDYVRPLDEAEAQRLARLIDTEGQKTPIAVYRSSARQGGEKPYTLIYGARRLRAMAILGRSEIEAVLRTKAEALLLSIDDNLALPTLDVLEQGEHVARFAQLWTEMNGPISHGGDRRSRFHTETLKREFDFLEKSGFYKDLTDKFGISKSTAWRLLKIGNMHPSLRSALRGTKYAKDQTCLRKLIKPYPGKLEPIFVMQGRIATSLAINPDLDAVLRIDAIQAGHRIVGRMETGDWREQQFVEAWEGMPRDRRSAALEKIGAVAKPLDPWPTDFPPPPPLPSPGNKSPLWEMMRDPYGTLYVAPTYAEIVAARKEQKEEDQRAWRLALGVSEKVNAQEKANRPKHDQVVAKAKAAKARKAKRGRPAHTPEMKRQKAFQKWFIPELTTNLLEREEVGIAHWAAKYCRKLNAKEQYWVACHLGNGHRVDDIPWKVERWREDEARELEEEKRNGRSATE